MGKKYKKYTRTENTKTKAEKYTRKRIKIYEQKKRTNRK